MKKLVYTAFIGFWAAIFTLLALDALQSDKTAHSPAGAEKEPATATYTLAEIARHDRPGDCWMAIEGHVYDITEYIPRHPAPEKVVTEWCGREATAGMRTKGRSGDRQSDHSARAWRMLERYRIGALAGDA